LDPQTLVGGVVYLIEVVLVNFLVEAVHAPKNILNEVRVDKLVV